MLAKRDRDPHRLATPEKPTLSFILNPGLLTALTLKNSDHAAIFGIEHPQDQSRLLIAVTARPNRIGLKAPENFIFEVVAHHWALAPRTPEGPPISTKVGRRSLGRIPQLHSFPVCSGPNTCLSGELRFYRMINRTFWTSDIKIAVLVRRKDFGDGSIAKTLPCSGR
jgi:hypothetical protein